MATETTVNLVMTLPDARRLALVLEHGAARSLALANGPKPMRPEDAEDLRVSARLANRIAEEVRGLVAGAAAGDGNPA